MGRSQLAVEAVVGQGITLWKLHRSDEVITLGPGVVISSLKLAVMVRLVCLNSGTFASSTQSPANSQACLP